jgi:hypothetical protein
MELPDFQDGSSQKIAKKIFIIKLIIQYTPTHTKKHECIFMKLTTRVGFINTKLKYRIKKS